MWDHAGTEGEASGLAATGPTFPEVVRVVPSTDKEATRQKRPTDVCICRAEAAAAVETEGKKAHRASACLVPG